MSEWIHTELKNLTTKIGSGATPRGGQEAYKSEGISLIRSQNILDFSFSTNGLAFIDDEQARQLQNVEIKEKDVLINITGDSVARVCMVPSETLPARVNQHVAILRADTKKLDPDYLLYYLLNPVIKRHLLRLSSDGATRNALTKANLEELIISAPKDINQQREISEKIKLFDSKISLLRQQNQTLEELAQTLFKRWFVDFEFPDENGKPYKSSGGKMIDSELGEIPKNFHVGYMNSFISESIGGDYGKEEVVGEFTEEVTCLRGTDLPDMKKGFPDRAPVRYIKEDKLKKCELKNGDIVIEISGGTEGQSTGRSMYINEEILSHNNRPMTCVNFCRILRPDRVTFSYFSYLLIDYLYQKGVFFNLENGSTGIKNLDLKTILNDFEMILPPFQLVEKFDESITGFFKRIQNNNKEIQSLTQLRDTLLPKLMSREIEIKV
jgi:type I restriction enzyme S subunit